MSERASNQPKLTPKTVAGKAARKDRLADEMRKNLIKRKRQQRDMAAATDNEGVDEDGQESR
ncbi:MAG: hypothetical protein AAF543_16830 [Pseudomonadota bacterium]